MRLLRDWVLHNWFLKVFSLLLATMLWMTIASPTSAEIGLEVPLEYRNIPPQMEITGDTTNTVQVRVRGSVNVIKGVSSKEVSTTIDLGAMKVGEKIIPLTPQNVQAQPSSGGDTPYPTTDKSAPQNAQAQPTNPPMPASTSGRMVRFA